jgi:hypothetical protein
VRQTCDLSGRWSSTPHVSASRNGSQIVGQGRAAMGYVGSMNRGKRALILAIPLSLAGAPAANAVTAREQTSVQIVGNIPFDTQLHAAREINVGGARIAIRWYQIEQRLGHYDWGESDAHLGAVIKTGLAPIVTLFGGNRLYPSEQPDGTRVAPIDGPGIAAFAAFASAAVQRYGVSVRGKPIVYELWNEPNTKTFWSVPPNPEKYAELATAACRAIKTANKDAVVVALGMEGTPVKPPYFVQAYNIDIYRQWAERAATPELMECVDGLSMHPYRNAVETYLDDEPTLSDFIKRHWHKPSPPLIINSEWGYVAKSRSDDDLAEQARLDLRTLLVGIGTGRRTNIYQSVDGTRNPTKPGDNYGLFTFFGTAKPSGLSIKRLLDLIGDSEVVGVAKIPGTSIYRFRARSLDHRVDDVVLWSTSDLTPLPITQIVGHGQSIAAATNLITGAQTTISGPTISVGRDPILLTVST